MFSGGSSFEGSAILEMPNGFQPELIYRKFPVGDPVTPAAVWRLSFGVSLDGAAPSVPVTLQLDPQTPRPDIVILQDTADFIPEAGLYHNYDATNRFARIHRPA